MPTMYIIFCSRNLAFQILFFLVYAVTLSYFMYVFVSSVKYNMSNIAKTPEDFEINYIKTIIHHIIIIITNIIDSICFVNLEIL